MTERRAPVLGGSTEAQRVAMTEANDFCEHGGKKFFPLNMAERAKVIGSGGPTGYTVTFRCLGPDDAELRRPNFQPAPNIVIEQRNQQSQ